MCFINLPITLTLPDIIEGLCQALLQDRLHEDADTFAHQFEYEKAHFKSKYQDWATTLKTMGQYRTAIELVTTVQGHSGRPRERTAELVGKVREFIQQSLKRSMHKRSQSLSICREFCKIMLARNLKACTCRIQTKRTHTDSNKERRKAETVKILC